MPSQIRDLLYFDFDKAASIWSQFEGGLRERLSVSEDTSKGQKAGARLGIPKLAEASLGVDYGHKSTTLESKVLHHDLLNLVEEGLSKSGLVVDLGAGPPAHVSTAQTIRDEIGDRPYLKAHGLGVIEDYESMLSTLEQFNDVVGFVARCEWQSSPEYQQAVAAAELLRQELPQIKDRNKKAQAKTKLIKSRKRT